MHRLVWTVGLGVACGDVRPLANDPPRLIAVNDVLVPLDGDPVELEPYVPGAPYDLQFEMVDPEGNGITAWFPEAPPGLDFLPDATEGTLLVPADDIFTHDQLRVILWDDHPNNPRPSTWTVRFGPSPF